MYKLVITNKYKLLGFKDKLIGEYDSVSQVAEAAFDFIRTKELIIAVNFMSDTTHNVAEFGAFGYFTVSYYDPNMDE